MNDNGSVPNNINDFEYTIEEIRDLYYQEIRSRWFRSGAEKIRIDSTSTTLFQRLNGLGNLEVLNGIKPRLEMDGENDHEQIHLKMIMSSSDIHWEEEKINRWNLNNHSLLSSIAKVCEDTETGRSRQNEPQPPIAETLLVQSIPDCNNCSGYIVIANSGRRYKCGCVHHTL